MWSLDRSYESYFKTTEAPMLNVFNTYSAIKLIYTSDCPNVMQHFLN